MGLWASGLRSPTLDGSHYLLDCSPYQMKGEDESPAPMCLGPEAWSAPVSSCPWTGGLLGAGGHSLPSKSDFRHSQQVAPLHHKVTLGTAYLPPESKSRQGS